MIEKEIRRELTCLTCDKTHSEFHREIYNHNPRLSPLIVCEKCGCGHDDWEY